MPHHRPRAFLVEDSAVIRGELIAALDELASIAVVGWAEDESSALAWLAAPGPGCELVIVDILLRKGSGLGVLRALRGRAGAPECIVFTNHASPGLRSTCLDLGANRVFDKSTEIDALMAHCRRRAASAIE
jgi:DNA-binding NarL/FixJ family response regulator